MKIFDAVVVGAGPGGMLLWERLTDAGLDVLLINAGARCRDGGVPPRLTSGGSTESCYSHCNFRILSCEENRQCRIIKG